jgi:nesprin-1
MKSIKEMGERILNDKEEKGREKIRKEIREVRERWERMEEGIKEKKKRKDDKYLKWSR